MCAFVNAAVGNTAQIFCDVMFGDTFTQQLGVTVGLFRGL